MTVSSGALSQRLALRLGNADISSELVMQAFENALEAEPEIAQAARADILAVFDRDPACNRYIEPLLYFKGFQALQTYRMAHRLWLHRVARTSPIISRAGHQSYSPPTFTPTPGSAAAS